MLPVRAVTILAESYLSRDVCRNCEEQSRILSVAAKRFIEKATTNEYASLIFKNRAASTAEKICGSAYNFFADRVNLPLFISSNIHF